MSLCREILVELLAKEEIQVEFPNLKLEIKELFEMRCYQALREIKAVLEDETLEDRECFQRIERILQVFEALGSDGGARHDFG